MEADNLVGALRMIGHDEALDDRPRGMRPCSHEEMRNMTRIPKADTLKVSEEPKHDMPSACG